MALDLTARLIKVLPEVTGQGRNGSWVKQEFVVETFDQYPKKVCLTAWGDKIGDLKRFALGDTVNVSLNLESREYNERWFTEARAWRIEAANATANAGNVAPNYAAAQPQNYAAAPTPNQQVANNPLPEPLQSFGEDDDLPF
jgi:hypothetical protein